MNKEIELTKSSRVLDIIKNEQDEIMMVYQSVVCGSHGENLLKDPILGFDESDYDIFVSPLVCCNINVHNDIERFVIDGIPEDGCQLYAKFDNFNIYRDVFATEDYLIITKRECND